MALTITDVRAICTAPQRIPLVVVRVDTSEPGLYGLGCATYTQRFLTVAHAVDTYMKPLLVGKDPTRIEDIWQMAMVSPYWRNGPILNNAISGVDQALWDIKGKMANMPVYELLGGATRDKIRAYETTSGKTPEEVAENVKKLVDEGWNHVRVRPLSNNASDTTAAMCRKNAEMFKAIREVAGWDVDLSFEIHRQCTPIQAIEIGKAIEPYRIHFFEDPFLDIPEVARYVTEKCPVPVANGERCFNLYELSNLVQNTDVAFLRPDMCTIGGITAGMKVAHFAEAHNVNIIPHNPLGPISTIAALHIDRVVPNFEVQEWPGTFGDFNAMIKGDSIKVENGYITMPEGPGLGIELVDDIAEKFPFQGMKPRWSYHEDGSPIDR